MKQTKQYKLFAYAGPISGLKDVVIKSMARRATQKQYSE